ncbi:hypothetical protein M378DRAFT_169473 [Amanita muscaria Koide BX008]|uniref:Transmembrane protein n=1 Tax=Amanita muscaria (strain Koide BX008) TaxID=946122 RepID=A0A0C2SYS6_AMAMK|nr:hypothetical protein M378DRAFT_169473 [Amanita muscaria Koide BX008]
MGLTIGNPFLIETIIQAVLYVLYLTSLAFALRWLLYKEEGWTLRSRREVNWILLTTAILLFAFSTWGIVILTLLLLSSIGKFESNNEVISERLLIAGTTSEILTYLIIDAVLIFRCWSVYQRSWRAVCIPLLLWLSNIVLTAIFVFYSATGFKEDTPFRILPAAAIFYCCNFATNLYTTSAIIYRVRRIANANNNGQSILYRVCRIVAGTGVLYASTSLAVVVATFLMPNDPVAYSVCNAINFSMAGIAFNLLLIRVGQLRADNEMEVCASTPDVNRSVVLSTVQFGVPSDNNSFDSERGYYRGDLGEASLRNKRPGFGLDVKRVPTLDTGGARELKG